jgi:RHS repeat-associated protein
LTYGYQGRPHDSISGDINFRNRINSPTLGRPLQQDPISFAGGTTNLYQWEGDNPAGGLDPSGLENNKGVNFRIYALKNAKDYDELPDATKDLIDSGYYIESYSAQEFYKVIKDRYDMALRDYKNTNGGSDAGFEFTIDSITRDGHSTAKLGGSEGFEGLTAEQIANLKKWMARGAVIYDAGCTAFSHYDLKGGKDYHIEFAKLLEGKGGRYQGFIGEVAGIDANDVLTKKEPYARYFDVLPGDTERFIRDSFDDFKWAYDRSETRLGTPIPFEKRLKNAKLAERTGLTPGIGGPGRSPIERVIRARKGKDDGDSFVPVTNDPDRTGFEPDR